MYMYERVVTVERLKRRIATTNENVSSSKYMLGEEAGRAAKIKI